MKTIGFFGSLMGLSLVSATGMAAVCVSVDIAKKNTPFILIYEVANVKTTSLKECVRVARHSTQPKMLAKSKASSSRYLKPLSFNLSKGRYKVTRVAYNYEDRGHVTFGTLNKKKKKSV